MLSAIETISLLLGNYTEINVQLSADKPGKLGRDDLFRCLCAERGRRCDRVQRRRA
jgi:hypothetical protein